MKKTIFIGALVFGVVLLSLSTVSPALAQGGPGNYRGASSGYASQGALGTGTGIPIERNINLDGALSDLYHAYFAGALNLPMQELTARIDAGETFAQIALDLGFDSAEISDLWMAARADAYAQAVLDGTLTQEQVDWLTSRGSGTPALNNFDGTCDGSCLADETCPSSMTKSRQRGGFGK